MIGLLATEHPNIGTAVECANSTQDGKSIESPLNSIIPRLNSLDLADPSKLKTKLEAVQTLTSFAALFVVFILNGYNLYWCSQCTSMGVLSSILGAIFGFSLISSGDMRKIYPVPSLKRIGLSGLSYSISFLTVLALSMSPLVSDSICEFSHRNLNDGIGLAHGALFPFMLQMMLPSLIYSFTYEQMNEI